MHSLDDPMIMREIIMDHYQNPRNHGLVDDDSYQKVNMDSSTCIDDIDVQAKFNGDVVEDVRFDGEACAICTASTSIMTELVKGKTKEEATEIAVKCLKDVGLSEKLYQKSPFELSGGQKRRVAIAGILAMEPEYFILDEPTAGLDPVGKDQILNLLKKLHEEKKITIILVSHSMEDVADYAQRVIVMNGGQVMYEGDKKEVFSHKKELEEAGLAVPFYRQVCEELADRGFPIQRDLLTLEETKEAILEGLKGLRGK